MGAMPTLGDQTEDQLSKIKQVDLVWRQQHSLVTAHKKVTFEDTVQTMEY